MPKITLSLFFFTIYYFVGAQVVYNVNLKKKQPSDSFYPLTLTTEDNVVINGYGNVNPTNFKGIIFIENLPDSEYVTDWKVINKVKEVILIHNDTVRLYPLKVKTGGIAQGLLNELILENKSLKLYKAIVPYFDNVYFIELKKNQNKKKPYKFISLNKKKLFIKSAKKVFNSCSQLVKKIESGQYANTFGDLKLLIKDYEQECLN